MAPVKKQKANKSSKAIKQEKKKISRDESVVSGQIQKKINKKKQNERKDPKGVVFIKHLPHGFFEEQLKKYFEQFGKVTRVRLARSRRTGASKGYAFVEFEYPEVAEVAAETMDNYLMFKQIVKASYIPPEKQQFNYFRTSVKRIRNKSGKLVWVSGKTANMQQKVKKHNDWNEENYQKRTKKQLDKLRKIAEKYAHLGIDINELIVQPNILTEKEIKMQETAANEEKIGITKTIKRKSVREDVSSNKAEAKKSTNKVSLEDLLGSTMKEDSEDEDYVAMSDSEDDGEQSDESSDEETYGFGNDSANEDEKEQSSSIDGHEETKSILLKNSKKSKKPLKVSKVETLDERPKGKLHAGGISKMNKKSLKQTTTKNKRKTALQISAAKELAKPFSKVKAKPNRPLKPKKSLAKVK